MCSLRPQGLLRIWTILETSPQIEGLDVLFNMVILQYKSQSSMERTCQQILVWFCAAWNLLPPLRKRDGKKGSLGWRVPQRIQLCFWFPRCFWYYLGPVMTTSFNRCWENRLISQTRLSMLYHWGKYPIFTDPQIGVMMVTSSISAEVQLKFWSSYVPSKKKAKKWS